MTEAIAVIGTAASVANIIDVLSSTISTIGELRKQWKEADFTFLCLVSQLTALRAALAKIKEWADVDIADPHHQLVMDLDTSMSCCRILISKIDGRISELHQNPNEKLDFSSKMKIVFGSKSMDDLQKMIERQTNALTLLLTACNW
jgi:guanine nucleotide-binding protein G(i) subunit alpha